MMLGLSDCEDVLKFISERNVRIMNLCHIPEEGRLKALSFSTADKNRIRKVLEYGERVDGSSLFSSIEPGKSDIYIVPRIQRAFVDPFALLPTLNVPCDYLNEEGNPLEVAPQTILKRAQNKLANPGKVALKALAELEFYVISNQQSVQLFQGASDRNYHECSPFADFEDLRNEALATLDAIGIATKYGHSEVGRINCDDGTIMEQHEIEFGLQTLENMAETICISKWVIRNICRRRGVSVSFIPKISLDHAGNGMHIHLCGFRRDHNINVGSDGELSEEALSMIGGILKFASSLAAFGNPTPVSYLRFIARKESPMHICWSAQNRLALIRIPLWWKFKKSREKGEYVHQTFEYRAPDAFANPCLLFSGLAVAADWGMKNMKQSLKIAEDLHALSTGKEEKKLQILPRSCSEAAQNLAKDRKFYEANGVFPKKLIDNSIQRLSDFKDRELLTHKLEKPEELQQMLAKYLHYG
jgi:glutamine synthetase